MVNVQKTVGSAVEVVTSVVGKKSAKVAERVATTVDNGVSSAKVGEACKAYVTPQIKKVRLSDEELLKKLKSFTPEDVFDEKKRAEMTKIKKELVGKRGYFYANDGVHSYINLDSASTKDLEYVYQHGMLKPEIKTKIYNEIRRRDG